MKRLVFIFTLLPLLLLAEVHKQEIRFPGAKGMNSNTDPMDIDVSAARLLKNLTPFRVPGALRARRGLLVEQALNDINGSLLGAYGYYHSSDKYKLILGVSKIGSGAGDTSYAEFVRSDTFSYNLRWDSVSSDSPAFAAPTRPAHNDYYDFEKIEDIMVVADGINPPWMFSPISSVVDSTDTTLASFLERDTVEYKPRVRQLGLEAPGQLRPNVLKASGNLNGAYSYRLAYLSDTTATINWNPADSAGHPGPSSAVVFPVNQKVFLSLFEATPLAFNESGLDTVTHAIILRQKNGGNWFVIDTVDYREDSLAFTYTDNLSDSVSVEYENSPAAITVYGNPSKIASPDYIPQPGGFMKGIRRTGSFGNVEDTALGGVWGNIIDTGKTHWIAYSYYDPNTNAESPLGPLLELSGLTAYIDTTNLTAGDNDTGRAFTYRKNYTRESQRPSWVRLYRSLADDSTIMVALYQTRANFMLHAALDVDSDDGANDEVRYNWMPVFITESQAVSGNFGAAETRYNYSSSASKLIHINPWHIGSFYKNILGDDITHIVTDDIGLPVIRPPYLFGAQIALSDVAYSSGRLWGIGDPAFPQRLYYSAFNNIYDMSPFNYLSMDESDADELVGIEVAEGSFGRVLYAFKHNKIFMVRGDDPEHDLTFFPISTNIGAANKQSIQKVGNDIYFLALDYRVYRLRGASEPVNISLPIQDRLWSLLRFQPGWFSVSTADPFSYQIGDNICWGNRDSTTYMAYNYKMNIWAEYNYGADTATVFSTHRTPKFSFPYDTSASGTGFRTDFRVIAVGGDTLCTEQDIHFDERNGSGAANWHIPMVYESPCYGDGEYLWRIQRVVLNVRKSILQDTLRVQAINGDGDVLATVAIPTPTVSGRIWDIGFTGVAAQSCVSFRLSFRGPVEVIPSGDYFILDKATAYYEKVSKGEQR